jgi:dUTP pyrophosphatase
MSHKVRVKKLHPDAVTPKFASHGDAGADLVSVEDGRILPGGRAFVKTGIALELPEGTVGLVHPRSGLAAKHGVTVLNAPGTIDSGYRGEIGVVLFNSSLESFHYKAGDRIAQLVVQEYLTPDYIEVEDLADSARGAGGFGSTGGFATSATN